MRYSLFYRFRDTTRLIIAQVDALWALESLDQLFNTVIADTVLTDKNGRRETVLRTDNRAPGLAVQREP